MKSKNIDMLNGSLLKGIILYTVPIILTNILQLLFNAVDMVVVGGFCGSLSLAAVGATGSLTALCLSIFSGLSMGVGVSVAHGIGTNDKKTIHEAIHTAIPVAIIGSVLISLIAVIFANDMLLLMGTPTEVIGLSTIYMRICFGGIIFQLVLNFSAAILRAFGDTRTPLIALTIGGVVNVVLNIIFVTVFHMDVAGVALATVISQALSMLIVLGVLIKRNDEFKLNLRAMKIYKVPLRKIMRIGIPSGLQGCIFNFSNVIIQSSVNSFGATVMSGNAAAGGIENFVYMTMNSFSQTSMNFVGQNNSAHKNKRVRKTVLYCILTEVTVAITMSTIIYLFRDFFLGMFVTDSQDAIDWAVVRLQYICLPYFMCGIMEILTGALRGMGSAVVPMLISIIGVCGFRIGWIFSVFQMPQYHTLPWLYFSYPFSWTFTIAALLFAFIIIAKRNRLSQMIPVDKSLLTN